MDNHTLERAILETIVYSDIFDYPLRFDELIRYLPVRASAERVGLALMGLRPTVHEESGWYLLSGRNEIIEIRKTRESRSKRLLPHAIGYGRVLGSLPFVRMVALTGSLAVLNVSNQADFDYMLVTKQGRVWTARAFALLLNRFARIRGHTLCPNLIIAETSLEWPLHDLYSARELCQMIPITGFDVYQKLVQVNDWAGEFLPNAFSSIMSLPKLKVHNTHISQILEYLFGGGIGDRFELWESNRKIARFSRDEKFGEETIFTREVCQGNFHHHRKWTRELFDEKMRGVDVSLERESPTIRPQLQSF